MIVCLAICYSDLIHIPWIWPNQESPRGYKCTYKNISEPFQHSPTKTVGGVCQNVQIWQRKQNDLHYFDLDLVTLRLLRYVDLDYTYLWCKFGEDLRTLRLSSAYIKLWPLTSIIWPWRQNFKILLQQICLLVIKSISVPLQLFSIKTLGVVKVWPWKF